MSGINVSLDNPYGHVTIPRAKLQTNADGSTVIANPAVVNGNNSSNNNPYASSAPEVREAEPEEARCRACCYRCRRK